MEKTSLILAALALAPAVSAMAQERPRIENTAADSVYTHAGGRRLSLGGYGEAVYSRNFYSDNVYRYSDPERYRNEPSHGRFDIPHAVFYVSYDFGKGWTMSSEIEFEHTGTGSATEKEFDEGGEWENETEKGGEVEVNEAHKRSGRVPTVAELQKMIDEAKTLPGIVTY